MRTKLSSAAFLVLLAGSARAVTGTAGGEAYNFLSLDPSARAVGMGGAYTALASDAHALFYNPAGLARVERSEVALMHTQFVEGLTQDSIGLALRQGFGARLDYLRLSKLTRTTYGTPDGTLGSFELSDLSLAAGYGRRLGPLSVGAGAKYIREKNDTVASSAYAVDAGLMLTPAPGLTFGAAVQNLGPDARYYTSKEKLPLQIRAGAAYRYQDTTLAADVTKLRYDKARIAAGLETLIAKTMFLRAGFSARNDADIGITGGVGWQWPGGRIDYAFVPYGDLGLTHRVGVTFRWGPSEDEPARVAAREPSRERDEPEPESKAEQERRYEQPALTELPVGTPEERIAKARRLIVIRRYEEARVELEAALAAEPPDRTRVLCHERLGFIAFTRGDVKAARAHYVEALTIVTALGISDGTVADAYEGMGRCLEAEGNYPYAIRYYRKAATIAPSGRLQTLISDVERRLKTAAE